MYYNQTSNEKIPGIPCVLDSCYSKIASKIHKNIPGRGYTHMWTYGDVLPKWVSFLQKNLQTWVQYFHEKIHRYGFDKFKIIPGCVLWQNRKKRILISGKYLDIGTYFLEKKIILDMGKGLEPSVEHSRPIQTEYPAGKYRWHFKDIPG